MKTTIHNAENAESVIGRVIEEYTDRLNEGGSPQIDDYVHKYPDIADELREVLPAVEMMCHIADDSHPLAQQAADSPEERREAGRSLGDYRILREVGRGGMGVVYEAEQISLRRRVALKILPFAAVLDPRHLQRFRNEALAAAQLEHPHIVPVYGVGCDRGVHHFAMKFIEGRTLAEVIEQLRADNGQEPTSEVPAQPATPNSPATLSAPTTPPHAEYRTPNADTVRLAGLSTDDAAAGREFFRTAAKLGRDVASALDDAHEHGVVHRDIKPGNIMVDGTGKSWVTDFGLAHIESDVGLTMSGDLLGTLRYMSPEQALAKRVVIDHRTDVYSLGVTLYELLTLRPAFPEIDRQRLLHHIAFEDPAPPRKVRPGIPHDLETIVLKAIVKNPGERYQTAQELADDLERYLNHQTIKARRPTLWQYAAKWCRRHRTLVWSGAAILLVSTLALFALSLEKQKSILEQQKRLVRISTEIKSSLRATETAIAAGELSLARMSLAEALAVLASNRRDVPQLAHRAEAVEAELQRHVADQERYQTLLKQARDAQDRMTHSDDLYGDRVAEEALALFGVLDGADLLSKVSSSTLSAEQKKHARQVIYETLLCLGDHSVRWVHHTPRSAEDDLRKALHFLDLAEDVGPATKALYWVREQCYYKLGDEDARRKAQRLYEETPATIPLDHYLPGHTAGWIGDRDAARAAYRAALCLQPDHYNSLFFLGLRHIADKDFDEAIAYLTACRALRPDQVLAYLNRAESFEKLGDSVAAEADYIAATQLSGIPAGDLILAHRYLVRFYRRQEDVNQAEDAFRQAAVIGEQLVAELDATGDVGHREMISVRRHLARLYEDAGMSTKQEDHLQAAILVARKFPSDEVTTLSELGRELGLALIRSGQRERANQLLSEIPFNISLLPIAIELGDWSRVRDYCEQAVLRLPEDDETLAYTACLYLTCPDPNVRDRERAAALAMQLYEAQRYPPEKLGHVSAAAALILAGKMDAYALLRRTMLAKLADEGSPRFREIKMVTLICNLQTGSAEETAFIAKMIEQGLTERTRQDLHIAGMSQYRAGNYDQAAAYLYEAVEGEWNRQVLNWLGLALVEHARGNQDTSREWFDKAQEWIDSNRAKIHLEWRKEWAAMPSWLQALVLYEEARALLTPESAADGLDVPTG